MNWNNSENVGGISIHGTKDRMLKARSTQFPISEAGHFMIVTKANEVGKILTKNGL